MTLALSKNSQNFRTAFSAEKLLSCLQNDSYSQNRFVFADKKSSGGSSEPEKEDEKKKEEEEKEKKEKEDEKKKEEEKKKKDKDKKSAESDEDEEEDVDVTKKRIGEMARSAMENSEKIQKEIAKTDLEKEKANAEKFGELSREFQRINTDDAKVQLPVKDYLADLVTNKKISKKDAKKLLQLDPGSEDFEKKWKKATKNIKGLEENSPELKKLFELKKKEGEKVKALDKRLKKAMHELRERTNQMGETIVNKGRQRQELLTLEKSTGLRVAAGQVLKFKTDEEDKDKKGKKTHYATIKEIKFEEINVEDDDGNVVGKVKTNTPVVIVESINPNTNKIAEDRFSTLDFNEWANENDVLEDIDSVEKLNASIGQEIKEGMMFEYEMVEFKDKEKETRTDVKVEIKKLDKNNHKISLDKEVQTPKGPKKEFSFDQFAKWFKQNEVLKQVESIEKLRKELHAFTEKQNTFYERPPGQYPPIEVKDGEMLYYDDGTNRDFVIKKVHEKEKKIEFEGGKTMSFTGFLRWVKRNEVEKKTADAEAHKATDHIEDPKKKELEMAKEKAKAEREIEEKKGKILTKPEGSVLESPDHHAHQPMSYLSRVWRNTYFLSAGDLFDMGKTILDLIKRRWDRKGKERIGTVGQWMFGQWSSALGAEFKTLAQSAENEEVNHHVHTMETMGIADIKHELHHPPDKDTLKAAITVMCKKGQMRWDDHHFWHALEHFSGESIRPDHYLEDIEKIIDGWWGQDTFREFRNSGDSSYNSIKKNFEDNATRLENDPLGLPGELRRLLFAFINGDYVNPCQYEEYLDYAMKAGKMAFEDKMFFLVMGIGATNSSGESLLHLDRVATLEGSYLNTIPLIDFFISPAQYRLDVDGNRIWDPEKKNPDGTIGGYKTGRPDLNTFRGWVNKYIKPDIPGGKLEKGSLSKPTDVYWTQDNWPKGKQSMFADFVRDTIAWDKYAAKRAEKAARDPSSWDHDDMDIFVQLLDEGTIDQITRIAGGARQQVSNAGIKNAFAGLNEFIRREINNLDNSIHRKKQIEKMAGGTKRDLDLKEIQTDINDHYARIVKMMKSFVIFDATIEGRLDQTNANKVRFSDSTYNTYPGVSDSRNLRGFIDEVRGVIGGMASKLGMGDEFQKINEVIPATRKGEWDAQSTNVKSFNDNFSKKMNQMLNEQGIEKVSATLSSINNLTGFSEGKKTARKPGEAELEEVNEASPKAANDNAEDHMAHAA